MPVGSCACFGQQFLFAKRPRAELAARSLGRNGPERTLMATASTGSGAAAASRISAVPLCLAKRLGVAKRSTLRTSPMIPAATIVPTPWLSGYPSCPIFQTGSDTRNELSKNEWPRCASA
jgi:hypothetical protein